MTIALQIVTVAENIAALNIAGVKCVSLDTIPENASVLCPVFAPRPDNFITDIIFTPVSFGTGGTEKMDLEYTMHWQYFHAPIGSTGGLFSVYGAMMENLVKILETIFANDAITGSIDVRLLNIESVAKIADAAGNFYHGVDVALRIKEFVN